MMAVIPLAIRLNLDPADFASLHKYKANLNYNWRRSTLLGADDKSGIAEIMTAIEYLSAYPETGWRRSPELALGPDEESVSALIWRWKTDVDFATQ